MSYLDTQTQLPIITGSMISYFSNMIKLKGGINLAQGIPGFRPPEKLLEVFADVITRTNIHQYAPGCGNHLLLQQLDKKYAQRSDTTKIFVTSGATEAVSLIYTYLQSIHGKDFTAMSFSPTYESYSNLPRIFGNRFRTYRTDPECYFDNEEFRRFFIDSKTNLIFIASPGNPYGKTISKEKLDFLIDLCEEFGSYLIIDSVYSELYFNGERPYYPIGRISPNVFYVNSFSKKYSITGWRIGYFLFHEKHFPQISFIHDYIGLSSAAPQQQAIAEFLDLPESETCIRTLRNTIVENYSFTNARLASAGFDCPKNDGGYFVWARLPEKWDDSLRFSLALYENTQTGVIPGVHFGEEWNHYIRINIAQPKEVLTQGIDNLIRFTEEFELY